MAIIELTVTLEYSEPAVRRVLHMPNQIRLDQLHLILQAAFGWENEHLYAFDSGHERWREPDPDYDMIALSSTEARLQDLIDHEGKRGIIYTYDMGDNWEHRLEIGAPVSARAGVLYPKLVKAEGACPPEDIGGIYVYCDLLDVLADPTHPEFEAAKEWVEEGFDPAKPPEKALKAEVAKLAKRLRLSA